MYMKNEISIKYSSLDNNFTTIWNDTGTMAYVVECDGKTVLNSKHFPNVTSFPDRSQPCIKPVNHDRPVIKRFSVV